MDQSTLRNALGCFATGITVITGVGSDGELLGFTANSFNSVSLDPPLVLFSLDRRAYSLRSFEQAGAFAVNILHAGQRDLSVTFASRADDKFSAVRYATWDTGCPILEGSLAVFECRTRATYDGGDHVIFVGEVMRMEANPDGRPLVYYGGRYHGLVGHD